MAEDARGGQRGRGHHLVHRLAHGAELDLGELGALGGGAALLAHHGGGEPPRALDGEQEDVAAGDAVDVGDLGAHRGDGEAVDGLLTGLLGAVAGDDGADARGAGRGVLEGALDRLCGRLTQEIQPHPPVGVHRVSSP